MQKSEVRTSGVLSKKGDAYTPPQHEESEMTYPRQSAESLNYVKEVDNNSRTDSAVRDFSVLGKAPL